jgi:hypothetical protein
LNLAHISRFMGCQDPSRLIWLYPQAAHVLQIPRTFLPAPWFLPTLSLRMPLRQRPTFWASPPAGAAATTGQDSNPDTAAARTGKLVVFGASMAKDDDVIFEGERVRGSRSQRVGKSSRVDDAATRQAVSLSAIGVLVTESSGFILGLVYAIHHNHDQRWAPGRATTSSFA